MSYIKRLTYVRTLLILVVVAIFGSGVALAAKRVIYFTATKKPTTAEAAEIAKIRAVTVQPFELRVMNSKQVQNHNVTADYVAGSAIPPAYRDGGVDVGTQIYPSFDPSDPPTFPTLPTNQATFASGDYISIAGGGRLTLTITGNTVTGTVLVSPDAGL